MTGELLRRVREAAGIKATDLAEAAGVHKSTLSEYENGRRPITPWVCRRLLRRIDETLQTRSDEFARLRAEANEALKRHSDDPQPQPQEAQS